MCSVNCKKLYGNPRREEACHERIGRVLRGFSYVYTCWQASFIFSHFFRGGRAEFAVSLVHPRAAVGLSVQASVCYNLCMGLLISVMSCILSGWRGVV